MVESFRAKKIWKMIFLSVFLVLRGPFLARFLRGGVLSQAVQPEVSNSDFEIFVKKKILPPLPFTMLRHLPCLRAAESERDRERETERQRKKERAREGDRETDRDRER